MNEQEIFTYTEVALSHSQIRLLTVLLGHGSSNVKCTMSVVYLTEKPSYKALSYTWGSPNSTKHPIILNDKVFFARENLWLALSQLRDPREDVTIWIDAICINQNDLEERAAQVRLMKDIFFGASCVEIWLGPASEDSDQGMEVISTLGNDYKARKLPIFAQDGETRSPFWELMRDGGLSAFRNLLYREYFSRVWIVQEILVARQVRIHCGSKTVEWSDFNNAVYSLSSYDGTTSSFKDELEVLQDCQASNALRMHEIKYNCQNDASTWGQYPVQLIFDVLRHSHCTDPHDKIYGFLGLAQEIDIPVDYTRSMFQLYCDVFPTVQHSLDYAMFTKDDIPFAAARFSHWIQRVLGGPLPVTGEQIDCAEVNGKLGSIITRLGPTYHPDLLDVNVAEEIRTQLYKSTATWHPIHWFKKPITTATVMDNVRRFNKNAAKKVQPITSSSFHCKRGKVWSSAKKEPFARTVQRNLSKHAQSSEAARFFLGADGEFGLVPPSAKVGDVICYFHDTPFTAILRTYKNDYTLVGRGYVSTDSRRAVDAPGFRAYFHNSPSLENLHPSFPQFRHLRCQEDCVYMHMDMETLQALTY